MYIFKKWMEGSSFKNKYKIIKIDLFERWLVLLEATGHNFIITGSNNRLIATSNQSSFYTDLKYKKSTWMVVKILQKHCVFMSTLYCSCLCEENLESQSYLN